MTSDDRNPSSQRLIGDLAVQADFFERQGLSRPSAEALVEIDTLMQRIRRNANRREVLGADYVDASLARADDFNAAFQQMTTEIAWGMCWTRPGIDRKTRSMINLTMLSALNRGAELRLHLKAALTNGVTRDEIKEILMQVGAYCGIPACLEAFKIATEVFKEVDGAKG